METHRPNFYLQWHITDRCSQRCKHCYLFQSDRTNATKELDLNLETLLLIAEDAFEMAREIKANMIFVLTGGDPILHPQFWQLLEGINALAGRFTLGYAIDILGNPFYLDITNAQRLKNYGVRKYQLSIDGLEEKHDFLRSPGSYRRTFEAAEVLKKAGISSTCMFTLSRLNEPDLIDVMKEVAKAGFDAFAFARLCRPENWSLEDYKKEMFTPLEYRELLKRVEGVHRELALSYPSTRFVYKDHLWELFFYEGHLTKEEKKELESSKREQIVIGGCSLGIASLSILADGSVYACRRFSSMIGKVPEQKLIDLFIDSKVLNEYRDLSRYEKCRECPLLYTCRGCGAVAYGYFGSFFSPDPQCWYNLSE